MKHLAIILVLVAGLAGASGCFLFHDDYPDTHCESDLDCFRAAGEACNLANNTCEVPGTGAPAPERFESFPEHDDYDDGAYAEEVADVE